MAHEFHTVRHVRPRITRYEQRTIAFTLLLHACLMMGHGYAMIVVWSMRVDGGRATVADPNTSTRSIIARTDYHMGTLR